MFLDLGDLSYSDRFELPADQITVAQARLGQTKLPDTALVSLTTVATAMGIASLRAPLLALAAARALAAWRGEDVASDDTLRHAAELTLAHRGDLPESREDQASEPPPPEPPTDQAEAEQPEDQSDRIPDDILLDTIISSLSPKEIHP